MGRAKSWAEAKFMGSAQVVMEEAGLEVLVQNAVFLRDTSDGRGDVPLRIGGKEYSRGLDIGAAAGVRNKVVIHLTKAAKVFKAVIGMECFAQPAVLPFLSGGIVTVGAGSRELYRSPVLYAQKEGLAIRVDVGGVKEFDLGIETGDSNSAPFFVRAAVVEGKVTFEDGSEVLIDELPVLANGKGREAFGTEPWFSFKYGGRESSEVLKGWRLSRSSKGINKMSPREGIAEGFCWSVPPWIGNEEGATEYTMTWKDPNTGLEVVCRGIEYTDYPTVEWVVYFRNAGGRETPIISDVQAMDITLKRNAGSEYKLHYNAGSLFEPRDYEPLELKLEAGMDKTIGTTDGVPINLHMPFFNIEEDKRGVICVVGWHGQWSARFTRDRDRGLRVRGGQELTHFKLKPGESARTPIVVMQFYEGNRWRGQNLWRGWMIKHNMPRVNGEVPPPLLSGTSGST